MAKAGRRTTQGTKAASDSREAIMVAFITLASERNFDHIGLDEIADRAGVSLATLRETFSNKLCILAAFNRKIDLAVLAEGSADPESSARDRLFEVMMRRFDALAPYKHAIRRMARTARCNPALAAVLHRLALRSQRWTLAAAGLRESGLTGRLATHGIVLVYAETMRAWLNDDDADLGQTMAALDQSLRRGERGVRLLCSIRGRLPGFGKRRSGGEEAAAT